MRKNITALTKGFLKRRLEMISGKLEGFLWFQRILARKDQPKA